MKEQDQKTHKDKDKPFFPITKRVKTDKAFLIDISSRDFYKYYRTKSKFPKFSTKFSNNTNLRVTFKTYNNILNDMFALIRYDLLYKGTQFSVPCNLGVIGLRKKEMQIGFLHHTNRLKIDWNTSRKVGKVMYHTNDHTNNFRYKWHWHYTNKNYYKFIPCREMKREAVKIIKNKINDYPEE